MSRINDKLGLKPAGKRNMMKLPKDRASAIRITSATCPACGRTGGAKASATKPGALYCTWCNTVFEMPSE